MLPIMHWNDNQTTMKQVSVLVGAGSIGQAIIRRVSAGKHIVLANYSNHAIGQRWIAWPPQGRLSEDDWGHASPACRNTWRSGRYGWVPDVLPRTFHQRCWLSDWWRLHGFLLVWWFTVSQGYTLMNRLITILFLGMMAIIMPPWQVAVELLQLLKSN